MGQIILIYFKRSLNCINMKESKCIHNRGPTQTLIGRRVLVIVCCTEQNCLFSYHNITKTLLNRFGTQKCESRRSQRNSPLEACTAVFIFTICTSIKGKISFIDGSRDSLFCFLQIMTILSCRKTQMCKCEWTKSAERSGEETVVYQGCLTPN